MSPRILLSSALLCGGLLAACAWSVPADPAARHRAEPSPATGPATGAATTDGTAPASEPALLAARGAGSEGASDAGAREIYVSRCGQCHAPFPPTHVPAGRWPSVVRHYGPRAGLFGAERERVVRWLQANAAR